MPPKANPVKNAKPGPKPAPKTDSPKEIKPVAPTEDIKAEAPSEVPVEPELEIASEEHKKTKRPVPAARKRDSDDDFEPLDPELQAYVGGIEGDSAIGGWQSLLEDPKAKVEEEEEETEEGQDQDDESEESISEEEVVEPKFTYHPSEEGFKESDLASRKKRRYLLGTDSFLELADPGLENALTPGTGEDENLTKVEKYHHGVKAEKDTYKDLCKDLGIAPNANFLQALGSSVLDLRGHGLTEKEMVAICTTLRDDTHIKECLLGGNAAGYEGGMAIAEMIENNYTMKVLDLSNTEIVEACQPICSALSANMVLESIDLSKNELGDREMEYVSSILEGDTAIKHLLLSFNEIRDVGVNEIANGLEYNITLTDLDLSNNLIKGEKRAALFFTACANHPELTRLNLRRNVIGNEGAKGIGKILSNNHILQNVDVSLNIMGEAGCAPIGKGLNTGPRDLETLNLNYQRWHQQAAASVLKPLGNPKNEMPIKLLDFGYMLDVHKSFLKAKEKAMALHPDLKIIHGEPYGMGKAKGPDPKELVIRRANIVCENFETPLVMLMEELAKEKKKLTTQEFRKFIKSCNLYKDKSLTDAFENVFATVRGDVDGEAILAAFDKEYPGLRKIPDPVPETDLVIETPKVPKEPKKGKGKGKKDKGKGKAGSKKAKNKKK